MPQPNFVLAFAAGLVSVASPCVFPLIPAFAAFMGGSSVTMHSSHPTHSLLLRSLLFVGGFTSVFVVVFYILQTLEVTLFGRYQHVFSLVAGCIVLLFAIQMLGIWQPKWMLREWKPFHPLQKQSGPGAFLLGMSFAIGWTPCIGPELGAILQLSLSGYSGLPFLLVYAAGLGIPFILIALLSGRFAPTLRSWNARGRAVQRVGAVLLIIFAIVLITDSFPALSRIVPGSPFNL
ncbi:MAG: cytochrome c biogenesis CcdA family protein [Candidatus Dormibacteria bacterium]